VINRRRAPQKGKREGVTDVEGLGRPTTSRIYQNVEKKY
jgi:hypothetical protein